jgi:hypothetical protein
MAASRSMLEALLARVQKRANEPRAVPRMSPRDRAQADSGDTLPPARDEVAEDDIEEYDDELIEIIDDAEVIPEAVARARAIEPAAFGATLDRRSAATSTKSGAASPTAAPSAASLGFARPLPARSAPAAEALRSESVSPRPIAATDVARAQGTRRELRATSFLELLDASLKLGS